MKKIKDELPAHINFLIQDINKLNAERKSVGREELKMKDIAERLNLHQVSFSRVLSGKQRITVAVAKKMSKLGLQGAYYYSAQADFEYANE